MTITSSNATNFDHNLRSNQRLYTIQVIDQIFNFWSCISHLIGFQVKQQNMYGRNTQKIEMMIFYPFRDLQELKCEDNDKY